MNPTPPAAAAPSLDRTPEGWDAAADAYGEVVAPFTALFAADALRLVPAPRGAHVIDVAAGTGALTLAAARSGARVDAVDFAPRMVEKLRDRLRAAGTGNATAHVMDGQALAYPEATFDAAYSLFGLIFFPDRQRGFRELHRVLRPGGRAVVSGWSDARRVRFFSVLSEATKEVMPDLPPQGPPAILSLRDPAAFRGEMEAAGFRDVRVETVSHEWRFSSAHEFWENTKRVSPAFRVLLDRVGTGGEARLRAAVLRRLHAEFGEGPVALPGEAHLGVGRR